MPDSQDPQASNPKVTGDETDVDPAIDVGSVDPHNPRSRAALLKRCHDELAPTDGLRHYERILETALQVRNRGWLPVSEPMSTNSSGVPIDTAEVPLEPATAPVERKRTGKTYSADVAAEVIRRIARGMPSRALRDKLYQDGVAPTTLIDRVLDHTRDNRKIGRPYKRLAPSRRARWERIADSLADDGTVTSEELDQKLRSRSRA